MICEQSVVMTQTQDLSLKTLENKNTFRNTKQILSDRSQRTHLRRAESKLLSPRVAAVARWRRHRYRQRAGRRRHRRVGREDHLDGIAQDKAPGKRTREALFTQVRYLVAHLLDVVQAPAKHLAGELGRRVRVFLSRRNSEDAHSYGHRARVVFA